MKINKLNDQGIAHVAAIVISVVLVALGGVFMLVLNAHQNTPQSRATSANSKSDNKGTINSSDQSKTPLSDASNPSSTGSTATTSNTPKTTTKTTTNTNTSTPSNDTKQPVTPLSALTAVIYNLHHGVSTSVTSADVAVPGPISTAQARPIVFTANGQTYFAYRQGQAPNFDVSDSDTANSMAIVQASGSYTLTSAYLDKVNKLTTPDYHYVGYSTGGN